MSNTNNTKLLIQCNNFYFHDSCKIVRVKKKKNLLSNLMNQVPLRSLMNKNELPAVIKASQLISLLPNT